jgi:hypothetical protein
MRILCLCLVAFLLVVGPGPIRSQVKIGEGSQDKPKKGKITSRTVQGTVTGSDEQIVNGAVVQLKNTKTLQVRSFITQKDGTYHFNELSPDVDYELHADFSGSSSSTHTLSSFDGRAEAIINLKLSPKKK